MKQAQIMILLVAMFFLCAGAPCAMAADKPAPAPTKAELQAELGQINLQYQLVQAQKENLAYKERDLITRAKALQEALKKLEPTKTPDSKAIRK